MPDKERVHPDSNGGLPSGNLRESLDFLSPNWCGLSWSDWVSLNGQAREFRKIPTAGGVYRVRLSKGNKLTYVGQTRMGLRPRLRMLALNVYSLMMPFNDPHTAAPHHWVLHYEEGMDFECSAAPIDMSDSARKGLEDMLLWRYRLACGESTLCNHGRFHPSYERSGDRRSGRRGFRLPPGRYNPAGGSSMPPLEAGGEPPEATWMGLSWSDLVPLARKTPTTPHRPGLYKILDGAYGDLLYVGQSRSLYERIEAHARKKWTPYTPHISYCVLDEAILDHNLLELETDLLGGYFAQYMQPPKAQYLALGKAKPVRS